MPVSNPARSYLPTPTTPFDSRDSKQILFNRINKIPGLRNTRIIYFDGSKFIEIRPYPQMCLGQYRTIIIRKTIDKNETIKIQHPQVSKQTESSFYTELLGAGLSCTAAILSWTVVIGSTGAIPISGGASTAIIVLGYSAATASSLQCANSIVRLVNETDLGNRTTNQWLDSQDWYNQTSTALDAISLAGGIASAGATIKMVLRLRSAGTPLKETLNGLHRQGRKRLTEEIIRANNPNISNKMLKALVAAGKYPKRFSNIEISHAIRLQLKDAISASLSFTGSAASGIIRNPNRVPNFIIGILEEFESN